LSEVQVVGILQNVTRFYKYGSKICALSWELLQSSSKEDHNTFTTIPREHWLIGSVHGTPKKLRLASFARLYA